MPVSLHPLPANPTTGQIPISALASSSGSAAIGGIGPATRGGPPPASATGGGGVSREVLKVLQDVHFSDDEDDPDCVVCAEPLDLSDINFKPCQCGLQICQFCYNHLLSTDPRCPGCRRTYDAKAVVFQPVDFEEVKKAKEKKARRAKTIKQLDSMGRRHLLGVRIVMKNWVYVVGVKVPGTGDEAISTLRQHDYFGQYGKISRVYLRDRSALSSTAVPTLQPDEDPTKSTGILIVYVRREDAVRAISSLDGIQAPGGPAGQTIRACYGFTRYCDAFLRGGKCDVNNCPNLHEWGGEGDCFTREDYVTALTRPLEYDAKQKQATIASVPISLKTGWPKVTNDESPTASGLPSSANWGKGLLSSKTAPRAGTIGSSRPSKIGTNLIPLKSNTAFPPPTPSPVPVVSKADKRKILSSTAMSRGRSTDSNASTTPSSTQVSPKKKLSTLPPLTSLKAAPPPPPGLSKISSVVNGSSLSRQISAEPSIAETSASIEADSSRESDAGPSSSSPAPETPTQPVGGPSGIPEEVYEIHSPFEEPDIMAFPASDPAFAFVLDHELSRRPGMAYQPSPFSKTILGLAELGILAPEPPDMLNPPNYSSFRSSFRPFDLDEEMEPDAGPSTSRTSDEAEGARATSRFDFARQSSSTTGRGPSPFSMLRRPVEENFMGQGWNGRQTPGDLSRGVVVNESPALTAGIGPLLNASTGSSGGQEWPGSDTYRTVVPGDYRPTITPSKYANTAIKGRPDSRGGGDEYDPAVLSFSHNVPPQQRLFSPETSSIPEDGPYGHQLFSPQHQPIGLHQHHQQQQPGVHSAFGFGGPSPVPSHQYRRF